MTPRAKKRSTRRERAAAQRLSAKAEGGIAPGAPEAADAAPPLPADRAAGRTALTAGVLAALILVSYFPALSAGFVWDDLVFAEEPVIREGLSGLQKIWFSPRAIGNEGHYWPVTYTSFWIEHKLWGLAPFGYHLVNVLLHLACTLLAWRLLARLGVPGAAFAAAVFAVHPLHVESVAWVIERKDLLSALFYLGAFAVWLRFLADSRPARYLGSLLLYVLALLSKSIAVTLPAALLLHRYWKTGSIRPADLWRTAPFFVAAAAISAADVAYYRTRETLDFDHTLAEGVLIAGRSLWFYAGKLAWPLELPVIYPRWEIEAAELAGWLYPAAAVAAVAVLWVFRGRLGRGPLVGVLFFAGTLSPVLGFVDYGYMQFAYVADRFQYLAGIGLIAVAAGAAAQGAARLSRNGQRIAGAGFAGVLLLFAVLTFRQAGIYRTPVTFFSHIVALNPDARDGWQNLSVALTNEGRHEEAFTASRRSLATSAKLANAHANLGLALMNLERYEEAEAELERARALDPRHRQAAQNLGDLFRRKGEPERAIPFFREAVELAPDVALVHAGLGHVLHNAGQHEEAVDALRRSLRIVPGPRDAGSVRLMLAEALQRVGRLDEAAAELEALSALAPADPAPLARLADLRSRQGRSDEADAILRRVRELAPDDPMMLQSVADTLRAERRYEEAIAAYDRLLARSPDFGSAHAGRASALFDLGRFEEALAAMERAIALEPEVRVGPAREVLVGKALIELGRPAEDAAVRFLRALEVDPRHPDALDQLGMLRFGQERYQEALELYERQLEGDPDSAALHSNIGATLYQLDQREAAIRSLERALELDPDHEPAQRNLREIRRANR